MTDLTRILESLNNRQFEAVTAEPGSLLVLAGAGSGKTRVLTRRIAYLIKSQNVPAYRILAVTFTNKAAREMRGRVEELLEYSIAPMFIGTFHGLSNRILRRNHHAAGLNNNFEIIDSADQKRLIADICRQFNLPSREFPPRLIQWRINNLKESGVRVSDYPDEDDFDDTTYKVYNTYEQMCEIRGLVDFAELLLRTVELLRNNQVVRDNYQERFLHVLVDEFQDTSQIQYDWLTLLSGKHKNITAVGDEDQSIFGWRGACVENMLQFQQLFKGSKVIRLEQNYRSSQAILDAANEVISRNSRRLGKSLWTATKGGKPVGIYTARSEMDEANFVAQQISKWKSTRGNYDDCAILYRTNAQSLAFEDSLRSENIPHQVYGGFRFYERQEVKTILAYSRLTVNPDSNAAFLRAVNMPPRGIGPSFVQELGALAVRHNSSLWEATLRYIEIATVPRRRKRALKNFIELINRLRQVSGGLSDLIAATIDESGLRKRYLEQDTEESITRTEYLDELINAGKRYENHSKILDRDELLTEYLDMTTMDAGDRHSSTEGYVQIMTLHSSKGLEFPVVFLTGMEEDLLPHINSRLNEEELEEERRLCYVGMTRAIEQLYLTHASGRMIRGSFRITRKSRFINEIPLDMLQRVGEKRRIEPATYTLQNSNGAGDLDVGKRVYHRVFGEGFITNLKVSASQSLVEVNFKTFGVKWLDAVIADLEVLD